MNILPAVSIEAAVTNFAERRESARVALLGFGIAPGHQSKLYARAVEGLADIIAPDLGLAVVPRLRGLDQRRYHSGVLLPRQLPEGVNYVSQPELGGSDDEQGVLQIRWPAGTEHKRALIEVWQQTDNGRLGGFVIGLRNMSPQHPHFIWA